MSAKGKSDIPSMGDSVKQLEHKLEVCMQAFQARLGTSNLASLQELINEFIQFKNSVKDVLEVLKAQMVTLSNAYDEMDNRSRRKYLLFRGIEEEREEKVTTIICDIISKKLNLSVINEGALRSCYRLGSPEKPNRPILVKFCSLAQRSAIWHAKNKFKGTGVSVAEFLTPQRRQVFKEARQLFGMHHSWSQNGIIFVKLDDGTKVRITSPQQLHGLPRAPEVETAADVQKRRRNKKPTKI